MLQNKIQIGNVKKNGLSLSCTFFSYWQKLPLSFSGKSHAQSNQAISTGKRNSYKSKVKGLYTLSKIAKIWNCHNKPKIFRPNRPTLLFPHPLQLYSLHVCRDWNEYGAADWIFKKTLLGNSVLPMAFRWCSSLITQKVIEIVNSQTHWCKS